MCTNIQNIDIRVGGNKSFLPTFISDIYFRMERKRRQADEGKGIKKQTSEEFIMRTNEK